jgi:phage-related minor tail protein
MAAAQLQKGILSLFNFGSSNLLDSVYNANHSSNPMVTSYFGGGKAAGGPVKSGGSYVVGEKGPELFTPSSSGYITPNHEMGGTNVVVNVDASGSSVEGDAGQAEQLGSMLAEAVQAELVKQQRPGGILARSR